MALKIDSHQHFWKLDMAGFDHSWMNDPFLSPIRRDFLPEDLLPLIQNVGVDKTTQLRPACLAAYSAASAVRTRFSASVASSGNDATPSEIDRVPPGCESPFSKG